MNVRKWEYNILESKKETQKTASTLFKLTAVALEK